MPLHRLYAITTGSMNPEYLTGLNPGGAGIQVAGTSTNPGISAPRLEESTIEVYDVTAPTTLSAVTGANTYPTPAAAGKLLIMSTSGIGGARWKLNSVASQAIARGQYGIVVGAGLAQNSSNNDAGLAGGTSAGNEAASGTKAVVMYDGPVQAFVTSIVPTTAISAGMPLVADGAGNLTYAGASPAVGTVLARALGPLAASTSTPALVNVYVGGY